MRKKRSDKVGAAGEQSFAALSFAAAMEEEEVKMTVDRKTADRGKTQHLIFIGLFLLIEILLIRRSFYGFNTADEMYYIGASETLYRGGKLLIDDWHPAQQLSSFLLHPVYSLIRMGLGSTEGIVMAGRFLYLAFEGIITVLLYLRFQRRGKASYGPAFLFLIFVPFGLCAMSYNCIEFGMMTILLAVLSADMEHSVPEYLLCGMLMAALVLANPFALLMYAGYGALCLGVTLWNHKRKQETEGALCFKNFIWMTLGAGIILLFFLLFVFQRGTISEVLANIPHILGDQEHQSSGLWYKTKRYFELCFKSYRFMFCGLGLVYLATLLDRKRFEHSVVYMALASVCVFPALFYYGFIAEHIPINYQMLPLAFWCLEAYLVTEHKDKRLFYGWYLPAMAFTMIVQYATNTGIVNISAAYSLCSCVGLMFAAQWLKEIRRAEGKRPLFLKWTAGAAVCAVVLLQFAGSFHLRMNYTCGEDVMPHLTQKMEQGPLKGVYTTPETARWYGEVLAELDGLNLTSRDRLLVVGVAPWIYLYAKADCGSYSTWQVHEGSAQLYDYYALHPEKYPNVIYIIHWADDFPNWRLSEYFVKGGYEVVYRGTGTVMMAPDRIRDMGLNEN